MYQVLTVSLAVTDESLRDLCRNVLGVVVESANIITANAGELASADLYIWDRDTVRDNGSGMGSDELAKSIFIVDRDKLLEFPEEVLLSSASVLLKPVDAGRLRLAIDQALSRLQKLASVRASDSDCRSEKDALLQCFLTANLRLQEYEHDRSNFLNRALHDFRAPLTSVTGYCGLLLTGQLGPLRPEQSEVIERVHNSAKRLSRLANGMFQLGMTKLRPAHPTCIPADIHATVDQALHELMPLINEKHISVGVQLCDATGELLFEPEQITQVLTNLLDNACKFTPRNGFIEIRGAPYFWDRRASNITTAFSHRDRRVKLETAANGYRIDVIDSGPGVSREHLESIFEEYTSYAGGQDRSGGGLGLAICKMMVGAHGGMIWAEPAASGGWFSFVLPYAAQHKRAALAAYVASR